MSDHNPVDLFKQKAEVQMQVKEIKIEMDVLKRKELLQKLYQIILSNRTRIYEALKNDLGKSVTESHLTEVGFVLDEIQFAMKNLKKWTEPQKVFSPFVLWPSKSIIIHEPYGRVLILGPWNYPFQLIFSPLVGAIAAGNCVVLKPSEISQSTQNLIFELITKNFDSHYIDVQLGGPEKSNQLLKEKWDFIFFTGSTNIGKKIMAAAAENLTPVCLELGGKSPCIIESDANLDVAARRVVWGKFLNAGQTCVAPDYLVIHENVYDSLIDKLKMNIKEFYMNGNSREYGRIINQKHFCRLQNLLENAKIIYGGEVNMNGCQISPTLIEGNLLHSSMSDEIFGPILPIFKFSSIDEALKIVQRYPKPLAAYYFSETKEKMDYFLKKLSFGGGCINDCVVHLANPHLPFGGIGESGIGAYHGVSSFQIFSHKKSILKKSTNFDFRFRYPPYHLGTKKRGLFEKIVRRILKLNF